MMFPYINAGVVIDFAWVNNVDVSFVAAKPPCTILACFSLSSAPPCKCTTPASREHFVTHTSYQTQYLSMTELSSRLSQ